MDLTQKFHLGEEKLNRKQNGKEQNNTDDATY